MKKILIAIVVLLVLIGGYYYWTQSQGAQQMAPSPQGTQATGTQTGDMTPTSDNGAETPSHDATMVGTWKSIDDAKFTRTFSADGMVTDAYQGDASATEMGSFVVVDPAKETIPGMSAASLAGMTILKFTFPKSGVMYFGVQSETESSLKLVNISGRGNILSFTKVQ